MIKMLNKLGIERNFLNLMKDIYKNPTANVILNSERLKAFSLGSGIKQGCSRLSLLCNIVLDISPRAVRQEKEMKGIQIRKKEVRLCSQMI